MQTIDQILTERKLVSNHSGGSLSEIVTTPRVLYLGFDPSADSLHVGNLVPYMIVRQLLNAGHKAILLVGGATGMIGDPSGKSTERTLLDEATITYNVSRISAQVTTIVQSNDIKIVNNADWLKSLSVIDFLRETGKHFTVNAMMQKETVRERIQNPDLSISFTEFAYPLLQAFDYYHLNQTHNCTLQVGGNDQWGNISAGIDFIRRKTGNGVHGITAPLIVDKVTGKKFGKSEGNAIWLDPAKTTPYAFYQFWINQNDASVSEYLKIFTDVPIDEINTLIESMQSDASKRKAQKRLAFEVTKLVHGESEAHKAERSSQALFSGAIQNMSSKDITTVFSDGIANMVLSQSDLNSKLIIDILVESKLAPSKREARALIESGGVTLDGEKINDALAVISKDIFSPEKDLAILKKGKHHIITLRVQG